MFFPLICMSTALYYFPFWIVFCSWFSLFHWLYFSFWHFHMLSCKEWIFKYLRPSQVILGLQKIYSDISDFLYSRRIEGCDFLAAQGSWSSVVANAHSNHKPWKDYCLYSDMPFHMKTKILNATESCRDLRVVFWVFFFCLFFLNKPNTVATSYETI